MGEFINKVITEELAKRERVKTPEKPIIIEDALYGIRFSGMHGVENALTALAIGRPPADQEPKNPFVSGIIDEARQRIPKAFGNFFKFFSSEKSVQEDREYLIAHGRNPKIAEFSEKNIARDCPPFEDTTVCIESTERYSYPRPPFNPDQDFVLFIRSDRKEPYDPEKKLVEILGVEEDRRGLAQKRIIVPATEENEFYRPVETGVEIDFGLLARRLQRVNDKLKPLPSHEEYMDWNERYKKYYEAERLNIQGIEQPGQLLPHVEKRQLTGDWLKRELLIYPPDFLQDLVDPKDIERITTWQPVEIGYTKDNLAMSLNLVGGKPARFHIEPDGSLIDRWSTERNIGDKLRIPLEPGHEAPLLSFIVKPHLGLTAINAEQKRAMGDLATEVANSLRKAEQN